MPISKAKIFLEAMGTFLLSEQYDDGSRRIVKGATFTRSDGGEPIAPVREATLLCWNGTVFSITGVEEVGDAKLERPQRFAQTWFLEPSAYAELERVERLFGRACAPLHRLGVDVQLTASGDMRIAREMRADGTPVGE